MEMIFETHAHYEDRKFDPDRDRVLASLQPGGIERVVNVASSVETTKKSIALAEQYDFIYASVGVHPDDMEDLNEETIQWLREQAELPQVAAVGEIGLDYYWPRKEMQQPQLDEELERQRYWFGRQLELAGDAGLPVIIHSRDAAADTLAVMREHHADQIPGVVHCFSYSLEIAEECIRMGYYIGIGGVVTFKNAKKLGEIAARIPLERILLETDCPYMAPEPHRGERNSSLNLPYVAAKIAKLRGISKEEVIAVTRQNAYSFYKKVN